MVQLRTVLRFLGDHKRQQLSTSTGTGFRLLPTFLHVFGPLDALDYLLLVRQARLAHKGFVQPGSIVGVAQGIVLAEVQELYIARSAGYLERS